MSDHNLNALSAGFEFDGYRIERVLGVGGFGITYLAVETKIGRKVAIKEFLPQSVARRDAGDASVRPISAGNREDFEWGLARFLEEARVLVTVNHPNVVRTLRYTEAHGTAYIVMEFVEGDSLGALLRRVETLAQPEIEALLLPLLAGIGAVHSAGFIHRDIKPDNIYIRADNGQPVLLDFGAARLMARDTQSVIVSHGYAPPEQYQSQATRSPSADLYAIGATLYRCMAGAIPPRATDRISARALGRPDPLVPLAEAARRRFEPALIAAVEAALRVNPDERPQDVAEFVAMVRKGASPAAAAEARAAETEGTLVAGRAGARSEPPPRSRASRRMTLAAAVAGLALVAGAAAYLAMPAGTEAPATAYHDSPAPAPARSSDAERQRLDAERKRMEEERAKLEAERKQAEDKRRAEESARRDEAARKAEEQAAKWPPGRVFRDCDACPEMVVVPAGTFTIGSPSSESEREDTEGPQREVTIAKPFAIGKFEVTFDEWQACVAARACVQPSSDQGWGRGRRPVIYISWSHAKEFAAWLSQQTGQHYRLPSEAEWEYAARAATSTPFSTGSTISTDEANFAGTSTYAGGKPGIDRGMTLPVGTFAANGFGLHDVHGNVAEYVEDCRKPGYGGLPSDGGPQLDGDCSYRGQRGGSWLLGPGSARSAARAWSRDVGSLGGTYMIGLRIARTLD